MVLNKEQLIDIEGGATISGTMLSAMTKAVGLILELGRSLGTAIYRIYNNKIC